MLFLQRPSFCFEFFSTLEELLTPKVFLHLLGCLLLVVHCLPACLDKHQNSSKAKESKKDEASSALVVKL